jgi:Leucine-rich repeat (LRR) protein
VHALADMLMSNTTLKELNISSNDLDEECAQILAPAISDNGAMTKLDMSKNHFTGAAAGKVIRDMLTGNSTLKDLDLSRCRIDSGAAKGISEGFAGNRALTSLDLSSNNLQAEGAKIVAEAIEVLIMRLRSFWYNFHVHLTTG